jgi:hypothetical protein
VDTIVEGERVTDIQSVGGVSSLSLQVENVQPDDVNWVSKITFTRKGALTLISIQDIKPGGRSYRHMAYMNSDTFDEIARQMGEFDG